MDLRTQLLIGGEWTEGSDRFPTVNPATEDVIAEVEEAGPRQVDAAVRSAREAFEDPTWRDMDPHRRSRLLWRLADLIEENREFIAGVETRDNGYLMVVDYERREPLVANLDVVGKYHAEQELVRGGAAAAQ